MNDVLAIYLVGVGVAFLAIVTKLAWVYVALLPVEYITGNYHVAKNIAQFQEKAPTWPNLIMAGIGIVLMLALSWVGALISLGEALWLTLKTIKVALTRQPGRIRDLMYPLRGSVVKGEEAWARIVAADHELGANRTAEELVRNIDIDAENFKARKGYSLNKKMALRRLYDLGGIDGEVYDKSLCQLDNPEDIYA